eukprot:11361855-Ditylum_brightwellii.AAC.1
MRAPATTSSLPTVKPMQMTPPSTPINTKRHTTPSVPPSVNMRVFPSTPQQPTRTPTEQIHGNTRVPATPKKKATPPPGQKDHSTDTHGNTRVPNTLARKQLYRHTKNTRSTPHLIPPTDTMPPPKTPPMYISTPKGWCTHHLHAPPAPHIIPPDHTPV